MCNLLRILSFAAFFSLVPLSTIYAQGWVKVQSPFFTTTERQFTQSIPEQILPFNDQDDSSKRFTIISRQNPRIVPGVSALQGIDPSLQSIFSETGLLYSNLSQNPTSSYDNFLRSYVNYWKNTGTQTSVNDINQSPLLDNTVYIINTATTIQLSSLTQEHIDTDSVIIIHNSEDEDGEDLLLQINENFEPDTIPAIIVDGATEVTGNVTRIRSILVSRSISILNQETTPGGLEVIGNLIATQERVQERDNQSNAPSVFIQFNLDAYISLLPLLSIPEMQYED